MFNFGSKIASTVGVKRYGKIVVIKYKSLNMVVLEKKGLLLYMILRK
jgi:hypothetical protein